MEELFGTLAEELHDVVDAHGVCASATQIIAQFSQTEVLLAISDPIHGHYDIWNISRGSHLKQDRWSADELALIRLGKSTTIATFNKQDAPPNERVNSELWQRVENKVLMAPLPFPCTKNQFTPPGAICILDPGPEWQVPVKTFQHVATLITTFLDRAFLHRGYLQQQVEFGIVSDISYSITSTLNLQEIIQQVSDAVRRVLATESLTIGLTDQNGDNIVFVEALMGPAFRDMPPASFKVGQGIAGWVAKHGEPAIVNNAYSDKRFSSKVDRDTGYLTNSVLCVPLKFEQRVIGVLEAINKQNGRFDESDSRLLQAISGPLAVAIENALLHTEALAAKRRIESIFSSLSEGLLTVDTSGMITTTNDAQLSLLKLHNKEIVGSHFKDVIHTRPVDFSIFFEEILVDSNEFHQLTCDLYQADHGYVPVLISATTIPQDDGAVKELIFVFSDVSQIREVERMRDDFFSNIVHELRTPLTTILMYARLLREGKAEGDPNKANRFLGVVERESDRLQKMVWQMLQLAKLESSQAQRVVESTYLNPILEQVIPTLADRATEKGLRFTHQVQPDLPPVNGSEEALYLISKNLIENAIKFTPSGTVSVNAKCDQDKVILEIADEGIGIPKEAIPNLFQRFYRSQTAVERGIAGTGLGLYMVKESLDTYGGQIEVTSNEGKGTICTVYLDIKTDDNL